MTPVNDDVEQSLRLAREHHQAGRVGDAEIIYREILKRRPDLAEVWHLLGMLAGQIGRADAALALIQRSIQLQPDSAGAYSNLGNVFKDMGKLDEAIASYEKAVHLKPDFAQGHVNLGNVLKDVGRLDDAVAAYRQGIRLRPDLAELPDNLLIALLYHPAYDGGMIHEELKRWNTAHGKPLKRFIEPHGNERDPERRLRIGYVSADFRDHAVGRNLLPLFRQHDHAQFEIFCYANMLREDAMTGNFRSLIEGSHNIIGLSDSQAANHIRKDRIDILVDLALHTANNRLGIFARKPAPVQATFAGYPGSTGLETIDYRLTDPYLDPPGLNDSFYSEKSIRLADSFWCYDPLAAEPGVNSLPAQTQGFVTFGCLNNFCKVNEEVLRLWAQVLKKIDRSRLMVLCPEGSHRQRLLDFLHREGIASERIDLVAQRPRPKYMELYHRIDLGLDTFPYNGHTTSLESFWMGVPVVTLVGKTVVGRAGLSQLTNLGLTELVAQTPREYVDIAAGLAADLPKLAELRRTLRSRMERSPLMDAGRFARNIEAAYREMWGRWCLDGGNP